MFELFRVIREYQQKKRLKKLLKRRLLFMSNKKIQLKNGQYFVNGQVMNDVEIVDSMSDWARDNFIFRNNDVYLPNVPAPLLSANNLNEFEDIDVNKFSSKYGNYALKYLLYNAFLVGYKSGIEKANNDSIDLIHKEIDELSDKSIPAIRDDVDSKPPKKPSKNTSSSKKKKKNITVKKEDDAVNNASNKKSSKDTYDIEETVKEEEAPNTTVYDDENNLVISSSLYKDKSYQKYLSTIVEMVFDKYGMSVDDISTKNFPSYILGEAVIELEKADTINDEQEAIKDEFYGYLKSKLDSLTKDNTTT